MKWKKQLYPKQIVKLISCHYSGSLLTKSVTANHVHVCELMLITFNNKLYNPKNYLFNLIIHTNMIIRYFIITNYFTKKIKKHDQ